MGSVPVVGDQGRLRFRISENGLKVTTEWFDKYKMKYILILLCYLTVLVHGSLLGGLGGHHHHHHDHNMTNHDHMHSSHDHNHDHMSRDHNHDHMKSDHMQNDQMPNHDHKMQDNDHHHHQMQDQGSKRNLNGSTAEMEESKKLEVTTKRIKAKKKNGRSRTGR